MTPPFPTRRASDLLFKLDRLFAGATESDSAAPAHPLLFDLTDLVGHFQGQRLPNGIERVQIELTLAALEECGPRKVMLRSEEHTSELQSLMRISYAVFCLKKKRNKNKNSKA